MTKERKKTYIPDNGNLKIPSREEFHRRFSGIIYASDFDHPISLTDMASRIASNHRFDETCRQNYEFKKTKEVYHH